MEEEKKETFSFIPKSEEVAPMFQHNSLLIADDTEGNDTFVEPLEYAGNSSKAKKDSSKRILGPTLPFNMNKSKNISNTLEGIQKHKKSSPFKVVDNSYETWTPPPDQTGDGKTKLNEKYGY